MQTQSSLKQQKGDDVRGHRDGRRLLGGRRRRVRVEHGLRSPLHRRVPVLGEREPGTQFNRKIFGLSFVLKKKALDSTLILIQVLNYQLMNFFLVQGISSDF